MTGRLAAAGFCFLVAATPAAADTESEGLVRDFIAWVDSSSEWNASVSVVRSDGSDTIAESLVFSRQEPRVSIRIEEVRLVDLEARPEGGFQASEVEVTSATGSLNIAGPSMTSSLEYSVPSAAVWNISMPSFAGVAIDPAHLMTSMSRFYTLAAQGSFDELSVPEFSTTQHQTGPDATQPTEMRMVYLNGSATGMADGVLRHQEFGPITLSVEGPADAKVEMEIEKAEADRMDIGAFARIFDASAYRDGRGDNIWRPLISRIVYGKMTGSGPDGATFGWDEIAVENVDGRQPEEPFTETWDRIMDPAVSQDVKNDLALEAFATMFSAWRVGTMRVDAIAVEAPKEGASFSLDSFSMTGWSSAGLDSLLLKNLSGSGPDGFLSLGSLELAGFVAPDLKALVRFAALEKDIDVQKHAAAIKETFAALPRLAHFGLHDVAAGKSEADSASLTNFTLDFSDWNSIWAATTDLRLEGLSIPRHLLELDPQATEIFNTLGYDNLVVGMSISDRWDQDAGTDNGIWTFSMKDAADVELSYSLTGLTLDWLVRATAAAAASEDSEAALMAMLNELRVASAKVSVTDRSLLDRAFAVAAEKQGLNVEGAAYREQMRAALPFLISAAVPAEIAKLLTEPVQKFLEGGQTIHADASPLTPLSVMDLMAAAGNPMGLPNLLNLTVKSEAPAQ